MATTATLEFLVHYLCATCDTPAQRGATKLNSILWHADVIRYADTGRSITGATYVRRQFGPAPRDVPAVQRRLQAAGKVAERQSQFGQPYLVAIAPPDTSAFTAAGISLVDTVSRQVCASPPAPSLLDPSRDQTWKAATIGEDIPMVAAAFGSNIDEDDVAWATVGSARMQGAPADAA